MKYLLYIIIDPSIEKVIYVGRTKNIAKRKIKYRNGFTHSLKVRAYFEGMREKGAVPLFVVIGEYDENEIVAKEIDYIKFFQKQSPLLNTAHVRDYGHLIKIGPITPTGKILT
jgi:excinuclease UvrABC nuclease subunit